MPDSPLILMVAGEASGDQAAAPVVSALRREYPHARILAVGGPRMREAGAEILFAASELSVMGFAEVLRHLPRLLKRRRQVKSMLRREHPDLFLPVDAPGFNLPVWPRVGAYQPFTTSRPRSGPGVRAASRP